MHWKIPDKLILNSLLPTEAGYSRLQNLLQEQKTKIDWQSIALRTNSLNIAPLLRFNFAKLNILDLIPEEARIAIDESSRLWAARHLAYIEEAVRLIDALSSEGVTSLPLKGAALMLGGYYPKAGLRAAVDIDLLIAPDRVELAQSIAEGIGYFEIPGRRHLRSRQQLPNQQNHIWPRRGRSGLLLELHHRAFHYVKGEKDFGFSEMIRNAVNRKAANGRVMLLPAPSDLAFHLIHHTIVDLQSTQSILRTLADLYFIFTAEPQTQAKLIETAREFGFRGAVELSIKTLEFLSQANDNQLDRCNDKDIRLLLETALMDSADAMAESARLFEYLDFSRRPLAKLGNLAALFFTSSKHLEQLYGKPIQGSVYLNYFRRPVDLMKRFNWAGLKPGTLQRVRKLRRIASRGENAKHTK